MVIEIFKGGVKSVNDRKGSRMSEVHQPLIPIAVYKYGVRMHMPWLQAVREICSPYEKRLQGVSKYE